jgi:hypothetical protein
MLDNPEQRTKETLAAGLVKGETACNRSACQAPLNDKDGSRWWNQSTLAFYCKICADKINKANSDLPSPLLITESEKWQIDHQIMLNDAARNCTKPIYGKVK